MELFSDSISPVMRENELFLKRRAEHTFPKSIELVNEAIQYAYSPGQEESDRKLYSERAFYFYLNHQLMPTSYSIVINLLVGNLPACFRDLRLLVEFLGKSYLADLRYNKVEFFQDRLRALQEEKTDDKRRKREIDFVREFDDVLALDQQFVNQWRKFSEEVHVPRYVDRIVNYIVERDDIPGYALLFPTPFTNKDIPELLELGKDIGEFTSFLRRSVIRYSEKTGIFSQSP